MTDKHEDGIKKLAEKIKGIQIAMMTTVEDNGALRSRPMQTQQVEFDGDLWFFTSKSSTKVKEVDQHHEVNLSYAKPDDNTYVSVSGKASIVNDRKKMEELWNPLMKAWFPEGLDDPEITLIKVEVHDGEYWDAPSSKMVQFAKIVKAAVTGQEYKAGKDEHAKISV